MSGIQGTSKRESHCPGCPLHPRQHSPFLLRPPSACASSPQGSHPPFAAKPSPLASLFPLCSAPPVVGKTELEKGWSISEGESPGCYDFPRIFVKDESIKMCQIEMENDALEWEHMFHLRKAKLQRIVLFYCVLSPPCFQMEA